MSHRCQEQVTRLIILVAQLIFKSTNSSKAHTSRDHFSFFFLSLDFHELWPSVMTACLFTEVKAIVRAMLVLGWVTTSVHYLYL